MATLSRRDSKGMYSWWWNSHITPKNSKWLQENLTGMDSKVKQMIKLIEEDADSFARRAEMYYKKRPELMKLVEEFYRAYRALAERYDNATGVIRQAHRTMAEAFPNQVPMMPGDDFPAVTADYDPHTPEVPPPTRSLVDLGELQKDVVDLSSSQLHNIKRNSSFTEDYDSVTSRKGLRHLNDLAGSGEAGYLAKFGGGRARKGLNFRDAEENEGIAENNGNRDLKAQPLPQSEQVAKTELEIVTLKKALAKLEAEKEADLLQYQQSLERLSNLESEVSRAKEDSLRLSERASKAEAAVQTLEEVLAKFQAEKEASLLQYMQYLDKISNLESNISHMQSNAGELNERAGKAETDADLLKQDLDRVKAEMEVVHVQYKQSLEMISNLEDKLVHAEEVARKTTERAAKAESEVETLKQALTKMTEEKEATALQYQQCLESISALERKIVCAEEEAQRLNVEIDNGVASLKEAEERCLLLERSNQTMHTELESTMQKMETQSQELTEKQLELGKLRTSIQEERLQFVEVQTAFQTLKHLHSQSQVELKSLDAELQNRAQILKDMEIRNQSLVDEVQKLKEENKGLNELNMSSALTVKDLQDGILSLKERVGKLEAEVGQQVGQRNALQQEIYHLKEELNNLNKKHMSMLEQITTVGMDPELVGSSVKDLQDENAKLNEISERERREKEVLLEKLEIMEKLLEKNALLEKSLSDLNVEIEGLRKKVNALEESRQSLLGEKSTLVSEKATMSSQLEIATDTTEKLSEKSNFVENLLSDTKAELEGLRVKSKCLEDSCLLLSNEKSCLITEREHLDLQLGVSQQRLEELEKRYTELKEKYSGLEKEKEFKLCEVEELQVSLDAEKQEHASFSQLSETRLAGMESQIHLLQEEGQCMKKEYEEQLEKAESAQIEIFILQKCLQDSEKKNFSLFVDYQNLLEASRVSKNLISKLEHENLKLQLEVKSLCDQMEVLRMELYRVLKTLSIDVDHESEDEIAQDLIYLNRVLCIFEQTQKTLNETWDENQQLFIEKLVLFTLLGQLRLEAADITTERNTLHQEFEIRSEQLLVLEDEMQKLEQMNEEVRFQVMEGYHKEELLTIELESLQGKLLSLHEAYRKLQEENSEVCIEKKSLAKEVLSLEEDRITLEEESCDLIGKTISLENLSCILKDVVSEKYLELKELNENLDRLHGVRDELEQKLRTVEDKLETVQMENFHLKENELLLAEQNLGAVQTLESELRKLRLEHQETKVREETLSCELLTKRNEVELWESQAAVFFGELQRSAVRDTLYEEKIHELAEAYQDLENSSISKDIEIISLNGRIDNLEGENGVLKSQLAAYVPAIASLMECVLSLENQTILHTESQRADTAEAKDANLESHLHADSLLQRNDQNLEVADEISKLQDLQTRIRAVENAMMEMESVAILDNLNVSTKLEAPMKQIEETSNHVSLKQDEEEVREGFNDDLNMPKPMPVIPGNEFPTKDIMLDHISECSSHGISKRENADELTDYHQIEEIKEHKLVDRELSVDKLEISQRFREPYQEQNKKKILERLDSDIQKLTDLQTTVQDLKTKVDLTDNSKKEVKIKYDTLKGQLEEAEEAIVKLFDVSTKLMKKLEDSSSLSDRKSSLESNEYGSPRRRTRLSEQARRGSEQIGRLQMELQRIQFLLLKVDGEKQNKGKTRVTERRTRVLLKDYIYGGARNNQMRKKAICCTTRPATKED